MEKGNRNYLSISVIPFRYKIILWFYRKKYILCTFYYKIIKNNKKSPFKGVRDNKTNNKIKTKIVY